MTVLSQPPDRPGAIPTLRGLGDIGPAMEPDTASPEAIEVTPAMLAAGLRALEPWDLSASILICEREDLVRTVFLAMQARQPSKS